jgi:hypothetical protein
MALNFLVELKPEKVDWKGLCKSLTGRLSPSIEFFPIQYLGIDKNYLGISVLNNSFLKNEVDFLRTVIIALLNEGHKIFELYGSNEFTTHNVDFLINKLLK